MGTRGDFREGTGSSGRKPKKINMLRRNYGRKAGEID
jgi:hypothetical protein